MIEGYAISVQIEVRWRDLDALGHVNNAVYFTYLEIARSRYREQVFGTRDIREIDFILASARCDFVSQTSHGEVLEVGIRIPSVGHTSFIFEYEVRAVADSRLVARGESTQVLFDYDENRKLPITEEWLARVEAGEGRRLAAHISPDR